MYIKHDSCIERADGYLIPLDPEHREYAAYLAWLAEGNEPAHPATPTLEQRAAALLQAVEKRLNDAARAKGYDSILSAATRAGYPGPFHQEGVAFATWMDATYAACYELLAQVQAGEIPEPNEAELLAKLPALELP
jgi:hypothetical protein